jgi:single-strand DNA-binding protein
MHATGNLGADAVVRHWNGKKAISFSIAYNEKYKDNKGTPHERTTWINCTLWRENEKIADYLKKGQLVYVEGVPQVGTYVSKTTGEVVPDLKLKVGQLELLGGAAQSEPNPQNGQSVPWE